MRPYRNVVLAPAALIAAALLLPHRAPVVDALDGVPVDGVSLEHGLGYLMLAPFLGIMDYLTVLTVPQHVVTFTGIFLAYGAWRLARRRSSRSLTGRLAMEVGVLAAFVVGLAAFYAAGVLAYRPMARLVVDDPDVVAVDFHSHTRASHDGRWDFTEERNRAWHRGAGIQVAFIADHDSVSAAQRIWRRAALFNLGQRRESHISPRCWGWTIPAARERGNCQTKLPQGPPPCRFVRL